MTNKEFIIEFDILYNNIASNQAPGLNNYEKSVFLTQAQEELVINFYNGKNPYGDYFEGTEELRRYLEDLVKNKIYDPSERVQGDKLDPSSVFYKLPDDLAFITLEQIVFGDETLMCYNGNTANVLPVTQDEYAKIKNNPFRGPTRYKALRIDSGDRKVEIISKYKFNTYFIKYIAKPEPIILESLEEYKDENDAPLTIGGISTENECKLNPILHHAILKRAVILATQTFKLGGNT